MINTKTFKMTNKSKTLIILFFLIIYSLFAAGINQAVIKAYDTQTANKEIEANSSVLHLEKPKVEIKTRYEKNVKLSWKKVENAKYYIVYRAKKNKYIKIKETKKTSFVDKKAKKRKTYKYKVVAAAKTLNAEYKSKASKVKKVYVRPKKPLTII